MSYKKFFTGFLSFSLLLSACASNDKEPKRANPLLQETTTTEATGCGHEARTRSIIWTEPGGWIQYTPNGEIYFWASYDNFVVLNPDGTQKQVFVLPTVDGQKIYGETGYGDITIAKNTDPLTGMPTLEVKTVFDDCY